MRHIIVGAGISGVSCANEILKLDRSASLEVVMVSSSSFVKSVENYRKVGQHGEKFDVREVDHSELFPDKRFQFVNDKVIGWNKQRKELMLENGNSIKYDKLCIATGSRPRYQDELGTDPRFVFLRDTQSATQLVNQLKSTEHVVIVGNGGIATELIYELKDVKITWMMRDSSICASFFPEDVEKFIEQRLLPGRPDGKKHDGVVKHLMHTTTSSGMTTTQGPALGPDWCASIDFGTVKTGKRVGRFVEILRNCVIENWKSTENEVEIEYTDRNDGKSKTVKGDVVIWAGGVIPNSDDWKTWQNELEVDGGVVVNDACETSLADVFSCGDVCSVSLPDPTPIWNQRQLWTQARQQGEICGRSMAAGAEEARMQNMYFEIFTHCTTFFGLKIVLLGDYKPERHPIGSWKAVLRDTEENQLVRCVVVNNVIVGALLIGETDMEETLENLILNKTDLEGISETFLEPGVDLDDYFD